MKNILHFFVWFMVMDFLIHRVSRSVCCTLRWGVINIPHHTVTKNVMSYSANDWFFKICQKKYFSVIMELLTILSNGSSRDVCLCEGVLTMKGTLHPASASVQCPAPACGHHCLLSISEAVTCRDGVSHEPWCGGGWECTRGLHKPATAVSAPDQLLLCWIKWKRFCRNWFKVSHCHVSQGGTVVLLTPHTTWQRNNCCGTWFLPCKILGKIHY